MDIQIADYGKEFVLECFKRFQGEGVFFVPFVIAVIAFLWISGKKARRSAGGYLLVLGLSVYNPLVITFIIEKLHLSDEYYRFLWMLPVTVFLAWFAAWLVRRFSKPLLQAGVCAACMLLLALPGKSILARGLAVAENIYKIPDEVMEISAVLHEISGKEEITVYADFDLAVLFNQYDPSCHMVMSYGDVADFKSDTYDEEMTAVYDGIFPPEFISKWFLYQIYERNHLGSEIPPLARSLAWLGTEYVVLNKDDAMLEYTLEQNCVPVHETQTYIIMQFLGE